MSHLRLPVFNRNGVCAWTLISFEDRHLADVRWSLTHGYAHGWFEGAVWRLHRLVLGLTPGDGLQADHINRDRLDNRRENLRVVSLSENQQNRPSVKGASSRFRGVSWHSRDRKWQASADIDGNRKHIGNFDSELGAAAAVEAFRKQHMPFAQPDPELARVLAEREAVAA